MPAPMGCPVDSLNSQMLVTFLPRLWPVRPPWYHRL